MTPTLFRALVLGTVLAVGTGGLLGCGDGKKKPSDESLDCIEDCNRNHPQGTDEHRNCIVACPPS